MLTGTPEGGTTENGTSTVVSAGIGVAGTTGVIGGPPGIYRGCDGGIKISCVTRKNNIKRIKVMFVKKLVVTDIDHFVRLELRKLSV